ncbi:MAG TPA: translesion DNA synthesis-associated protein ImuA [Burkholderiales bacterium]|nr:translesion DNA synthesis-associated protein ImuA [Burkholderiales bacterium]
MSSLASVLHNPAIWRGDEPARVALPGIPTGFAELDRELPGGGWPRGMVSELLTERSGIGELSLLMPALARLSAQDGWLMLVAPPWIPYAPALAARGIRLSKVIVARTASDKDTMWAAEQSLRAGNCPAVLLWPKTVNEHGLRRLQLAAEEGGSFGVVFGESVRAAFSSPAPLRLRLGVRQDRLSVKILKRRGSGLTPTLWLDAENPGAVVATPPRIHAQPEFAQAIA